MARLHRAFMVPAALVIVSLMAQGVSFGQCICDCDCPSGTICLKHECNCVGTCGVPPPIYCPCWIVPVCGCDGRVYNNACEASGWHMVSVDPTWQACLPTCAVTYSPDRPITGDLVTFHSGASDRCGQVVSVEWDFGDGATASGDPATHQYAVAQTYTVTVRVCDDQGLCRSCKQIIKVLAPGECVADTDCPWGQMCWKIDCGCVGMCIQAVPIVCYETYAPVCGCDGRVYSNDCYAQAHGVSVDPTWQACLPTCAITQDVEEPTSDDVITFNSGAADDCGLVVSVDWDFGDGSTASGDPGVHKYAAPGMYTVTATVCDDEMESLCASCQQTLDVICPTHRRSLSLFGNRWHMITLPGRHANPDPWEVFDELRPPNKPVDLLSGNLHRYDHEGMRYVTYNRATPGEFGEIRPGEGYWLWMFDSQTIFYGIIACPGASEGAIHFPTTGWYLIGLPDNDHVYLDDTWWRTGTDEPARFRSVMNVFVQDPLIYWSSSESVYLSCGVLPTDTDTRLYARQGYWVYTFVDDLTMEVSPP